MEINQYTTPKGWTFVERYAHDQYITYRYALGCLLLERTYEGSQMVSSDIQVAESDSIPVSPRQLALLTDLYAQWDMQQELRLPLKRKWYDMTAPDGKTEDYREITPYWLSRLCLYKGEAKSRTFWEFAPLNLLDFDPGAITFKPFDLNVMTLGYPGDDKERVKVFRHAGIEVREGRPEWGAIPGSQYLVVKHGDVFTNASK